MTVTGVVRVDLSRFVRHGGLVVDDAVTRHLFTTVGGVPDDLAVEVWIGDAPLVDWLDGRAPELLTAMQTVISGSNPDGVERAVRGLRRFTSGSAA